MFDSKNLEQYIDFLDAKLKEFADRFNFEKSSFDIQTLNHAYLLYERTLSSFANTEIKYKLTHDHFNVLLTVNEFPIKFENGISSSTFSNLVEEVSIKKEIKPWNYCVVDGYFKISQFLNEETTHIFVEYKLQNKFEYIDLALDFLKYKAYTYVNNLNMYFAYVILNKEEDYPTIKKGDAPYYMFINDTIAAGDKGIGDCNIYIYRPHIGKKDTIDFERLNNAIDKVGNVAVLSKKVLCASELLKTTIPSDKVVFIENMSHFNRRVVKSYTLQKNCKFINELWKATKDKDIFNDVKRYFEKNADDTNRISKIIAEGSQYKELLLNQINISNQKDALENGVNGGNTTSLFIVAFLDYFKNLFKIDCDNPRYGFKNIGKGNHRVEHNWETTANRFKKKLSEHFSYASNNFKIKKLAYCLLFYLHNVYSVIYDFDENGEVVRFSEKFKYYELLDDLQIAFDKAMRAVKYRGERLLIEDYIEHDDDNQKAKLLEFVEYIINTM